MWIGLLALCSPSSYVHGLGSCAYRGTVIASIASGAYVQSLHSLASSAALFGFQCVATLAYDKIHASSLQGLHVSVLEVPYPPLLPRTQWCDSDRNLYGWRRTHLYKMRLWRLVLEARFDLLSLDANYQMVRDPMPFIHGARMSVVATHDGPTNKLLNIGLFWMLSSNTTLELVHRVENRTWGAWDQYVVNEELSFNPAFRNVTCCHSMCIKRALTNQGELKKEKSSQNVRRGLEGKDQCAASVPDAARPPQASRLTLKNRSQWSPSVYTKIGMPNHRKFGRCTLMKQVCPQRAHTTLDSQAQHGSVRLADKQHGRESCEPLDAALSLTSDEP
jgi:hypothetical protein